jgi:hypothetical protein
VLAARFHPSENSRRNLDEIFSAAQTKINAIKTDCGHRCTGENFTGTEDDDYTHHGRAIIGLEAEKN